MEKIQIYPIKKYSQQVKNCEEYDFSKGINVIKQIDKGYHEKICENKSYKIFMDVDGHLDGIDTIIEQFISFMAKLRLFLERNEVYYTENKSKKGSFHVVIPKYHASCKTLKTIMTLFAKEYKLQKIIDTCIYRNGWFRLPFQSKEGNPETKHIIITGKISHYILEHIQKDSICIDNLNSLFEEKK